MTENEEKAIRWMNSIREDAVVTLDHIKRDEPNVSPMLYAGRKTKAETIIKVFEELEQYRSIGSIEEIKEVVRFLSVDNDNSIIEDIEELYKYKLIGTVEEFRKTVERQRKKKVKKIQRHRGEFVIQHCPNCNTDYEIDQRHFTNENYCKICGKLLDSAFGNYCGNCGQAIDWDA